VSAAVPGALAGWAMRRSRGGFFDQPGRRRLDVGAGNGIGRHDVGDSCVLPAKAGIPPQASAARSPASGGLEWRRPGRESAGPSETSRACNGHPVFRISENAPSPTLRFHQCRDRESVPASCLRSQEWLQAMSIAVRRLQGYMRGAKRLAFPRSYAERLRGVVPGADVVGPVRERSGRKRLDIFCGAIHVVGNCRPLCRGRHSIRP
jgi:hypothetical protein